jgi:homoserine dehydrogenase
MKNFKIAILGCGTVGGGTARILLDLNNEISLKNNIDIKIVKIVDLFPKQSAAKHGLPLNLFAGNGNDLSKEEAAKYTDEIIASKEIDLVVETIGGTSEYVLNTVLNLLKSKKHVVTANKALLAGSGNVIFDTAKANGKYIGYEASVCGAIPVIKSINECFNGDEICSISGIMNGTSNYILSKMQEENLSFAESLKLAQKHGYAEADPTLDLNGYDAAHKLIILIKLAFGVNLSIDQLYVRGIQNIEKEDLVFAGEMGCNLKLICYAEKKDNSLYATIQPMMVRYENFLSRINGSTNALRIINRYSGENILVGKGAGSLETGSAIVSDIIYIAKYQAAAATNVFLPKNYEFKNLDMISLPYNIIFDTLDIPGITGLVTTAIGNQSINIDTVSHNRHSKKTAVFSIATMPCTLDQVKKAIAEIRHKKAEVFHTEPKIFPILY